MKQYILIISVDWINIYFLLAFRKIWLYWMIKILWNYLIITKFSRSYWTFKFPQHGTNYRYQYKYCCTQCCIIVACMQHAAIMLHAGTNMVHTAVCMHGPECSLTVGIHFRELLVSGQVVSAELCSAVCMQYFYMYIMETLS